MAADADRLPLLRTFQRYIEDMRSLVQCKICIKPLYEPFILGCGHCYCYSCLTSWFTGGNGDRRRRQNMKCPDCRAAVVVEPSPNYVLRDLVHMFISRTELLPEDETTQEHELAKAEEVLQMTSDRNGVGLFKGAFRIQHRQLFEHPAFARRGPMHDPHDGVDRCPECHWELEGGRCNQCEWSISDEDVFSDSESESDMEAPPVRRRFIDPMESPTGSFLAALDDDMNPFGRRDSHDGGSVITISSDVDDIDPVDHELGDADGDTHSEAESDLPVAMGGRPRRYRNQIHAIERELDRLQRRGYDSDVQSTNYNDSEMGDTNLQTSDTGISDEDETEEDSSEMDGFIEHDTPTHVPRRAPMQDRFNARHGIYITSNDEDSDDDTNTDREPSQAPTTMTNTSATTANSSSEESSEDESRRTPVPRSRPSRQSRVILDDSDEDQGQEKTDSDDSNGDGSDATEIPAQTTTTRRARLQTQRVRRGNNTTRRTLVSPPRRPSVRQSTAGFHPYPLQTTTSRPGMRQAYVAG